MLDLLPTREIFVAWGPLVIRWYGLLYVLAISLGWWVLPRLAHWRGIKLSFDDQLQSVVATSLGILLGGRLGYVLFYEPIYFWQHPLEILKIWQGGMASHGGMIGVGLAVLYLSRTLRISFLTLTDLLVIPAAVGLVFGRLGNYINYELYGVPTAVWWGDAIPGAGVRHPVPLYAAVKDIGVAAVCTWYFFRGVPTIPGRVTALFLILYGSVRIIVDIWREPFGWQVSLGDVTLQQSQLLTIPMIVAGILVWHYTAMRTKNVQGGAR